MSEAESPPPPDATVVAITPGSGAWLQFEKDVAALMGAHWIDCVVEHDVSRVGRISGRKRQIDVLVTGTLAGVHMEMVIECKRNATRKLGIGVVDQFVGKLEDLGADRGMLWTYGSFDAGATARATGAACPRIELRTHDDYLRDIEVPEEFFAIADCPNSNCWGELSWSEDQSSGGRTIHTGRCDSCGTLAGKCPDCDDITSLDWSSDRCDGCHALWSAHYDSDGGVSVDWEPS